MLTPREKGLIQGIIKHCNKINEKMVNLTREQFNNDEDLIIIVCFSIMQIGELAKSFSDEFITKYSTLPWKQIKGMRDKVAHGYGTIDLDKVWDTALININPLLQYCEQILKENEEQ